jgi:NitT/TauT family transport system substrate-binding protein
MKRTRFLTIGVAMSLALGACGSTGQNSPSATTDSGSQSTDPVAGQTLRVVYAADSIGINDFVTKLGFDKLVARGLKVDYQFVAEDTLGIQAVLRGDADLAGGTPPVTINAFQQDPNVQFLAQYNRQAWSLASQSDITDVKQLEGKTVAVHGETSFTKTVADLIIKKYNLKNVNVVIIPGSEVRAQALLSGQIDATVLDIQDVALAQEQAPGKINVIVRFSELYPQLTSVRWVASKKWIDSHRDLAKEIVKASIEANREAVANPDATIAAAQAYYPDMDPKQVESIIRQFIEGKHWTLDGGMTAENAKFELQFYKDAGQATVESTDENVQALYRLDILNEVLDDVGRVEN